MSENVKKKGKRQLQRQDQKAGDVKQSPERGLTGGVFVGCFHSCRILSFADASLSVPAHRMQGNLSARVFPVVNSFPDFVHFPVF